MRQTFVKCARGVLRRAFPRLTLGALILSACGSGGTNGGGGPPPPPSVKILYAGAYYPGNNYLPALYAIAGQGAFTLIVTGSGFTSSSVVKWNGNSLTTLFGDSSDLNAPVPSDLIAQPGKASITVVNSGATSNAVEFQIASSATLTAGVVQLLSAAPDGSPASGDSMVPPALSATGRYVAFQSFGTNLAPGPASGFGEIYERDTCIGASSDCTPSTIRVSVTYNGSAINAGARFPAISADGRYVAFETYATNILPNSAVCAITPGPGDCAFLRDTCIGAPAGCTPTTTPISLNAQGAIAPGYGARISPEGRFVSFYSTLAWLGMGSDTSGDVFVRDTCNTALQGCTLSTRQLSYASDGSEGGGASRGDISATARFLAFYGGNFVPNQINGPGAFWRDTCFGAGTGCTPTTLRADVSNSGAQPTGTVPYALIDFFVPISADGRIVAFGSGATNLVTTNVNANCAVDYCGGVYVRDTCAGVPAGCTPSTNLVSIANDGAMGNCSSPGNNGGLTISTEGRFVAFGSIATNLTPDDTFPACGFEDVFVRDTCFNAPSGCVPSTVRVSVANTTNPGVS